jgi:hypothetical protein
MNVPTDPANRGPAPGYVRLGPVDLPGLVHAEVVAEAEARGVAPLDVVAEAVAAWALRRREGRAEQRSAAEEEAEG